MTAINKDTIVNGGLTFLELADLRREAAISKTISISFNDLFGDLSNCLFQGNFELHDLNLNSLEGCPALVNGSISLNGNSQLKNLKNCPVIGRAGAFLSCQYCANLESLEGLENLLNNNPKHLRALGLKLFLSGNPKLTDISALSNEALHVYSIIYLQNTPVSVIDIIASTWNKRRKCENYNFLHSDFSEIDLEKAFAIYEKVERNKEKLSRALNLL